LPDEHITPQPLPGNSSLPDERITSQPLAGNAPASDSDWFVLLHGKDIGPFTLDELKANAAAGTLGPEDLVRQRNGSWAPAKSLPFLATHLRDGVGTMPTSSGDRRTVPAGIGGWLVLPAIGLIVGPLVTAWFIFVDFKLIDSPTASEPGIYNMLVGEILLNSGVLLFQGYVAIVFFRRKRAAPKLMIALYLLGIIVTIVDCLMVASALEQTPNVADAVRPAVQAAIWIPYFLLSRRVKATFIY